MKKYLSALLAVCLMAAALSMPASAQEYTYDSPATGDFGTPTSTEDIIQANAEPANKDRSKNSALIPPGFGTPTSYLPNSGVYLTPNLAADGPLNSGTLIPGSVTVGGGTVTLPGLVDVSTPSYPTTSYPTASGPVTAFTDVTSDLYYSNGSLGTLEIPAIGLTVKIVQGTDSKALAKGAGHFTSTSIWDGNVALAGHNRGVTNHFGKIHTLDTGNTITLTTALGTRTYTVTSVSKVDVMDNTMLEATSDNCITLFTCVMNQPSYRWCVRAVES